MSDELFVDGISGIGFGKGAVRIDFFAMAAGSLDGKGQPAKEHRQRLIMTTEGFVESFALLAGVMEKLKAAGLISPRPAAPAASTAANPAKEQGATGGTGPGDGPGGCPSPNF